MKKYKSIAATTVEWNDRLPSDIRELIGRPERVVAWTTIDPDAELGKQFCCELIHPIVLPFVLIFFPYVCFVALFCMSPCSKEIYWILTKTDMYIVSPGF